MPRRRTNERSVGDGPQMEPIDRARDPDAAAQAAIARAKSDLHQTDANAVGRDRCQGGGPEPQLPLSEPGEAKR